MTAEILIARSVYPSLANWAADRDRKILLLRGARQVGKTFLARKLGATFPRFLEVNFLSEKRIHQLFQGDLDVKRITDQLSALYNVPLIDGETLLFFDEVQECPGALEALRFFYETRPGLAVVAAGSLLEFALAELPSFGVGRVQSLFVYPVSFTEFLLGIGEQGLYDYLKAVNYVDVSANRYTDLDPVHLKLKNLFQTFLFLGGLPEVISKFIRDRDLLRAGNLIDTLRRSYEDDFIKYRKRIPEYRLREVFQSAALQAGKKFVYSHAYVDADIRTVAQSVERLTQAGIVNKVFHSSANGVPLGAELDPRRFKCLPFDHGIYQRMLGVIPAEMMSPDFDPIHKGALAEVFAGCALLAASNPLERAQLYYWSREAKSSNAEVDYLLQVGGRVVPLEIKSGTKGKMQSLHRFIAEKQSRIAVRSSLENFARYGNILVVPLYALSELERIVLESLAA